MTMDESALDYKKDSIEKHILTKIPVVMQNSTIADVFSLLEKRNTKFDSVDYIYVINKKEMLIGFIYIQDLFNNPKSMRIKKFIKKNIITISINAGMEKVAHLALKHNLKQIPVTRSKKLVGVVLSRHILSTINRSLKEDIFHFAGIHKAHLDFENSMKISLFKALMLRLPWISTGLIGAMIIALYIGLFEETISKYVIIASFVPAIVYLSDALGGQFQTIFIRDLAILGKDLNLKEYFIKQINIGVLISFVVGMLLFISISLIWRLPRTAFIISLASFITIITASINALLITHLLNKFKFDPALGGGPIATIMSDLISVIIYFIIVVLLI
jgi:magnesium transporter